MDTIWIEIVLIAAGILANGFFSGSEIALVSSRISRLAQLRHEGVRGAARAMRLKESPQGFLATIQIAITAVGTLASAVGGATAVESLTPWLAGLGVPGAKEWAGPIALGIVILLITYVSLVIGELVPKAIALRDPERMACLVAAAIFRLSRLSSVVGRVLTASTNAILHVLGLGTSQESPFVSEEEVRYLVREGAAMGIFEKVEEELVRNVFEFADTTVREIMTPRPKMLALDVATPADQVLPQAVEIGHSRIPVYRDAADNPVGILVMKDLLRAVAAGVPPVLSELIHPPLFIPETVRISVLLREFQRGLQNLALVVDEYGSIAGLVTVEDVLEEIVGELREEGEVGAAATNPSPDGSYLLDGMTPLREVRARLTLPVEDSESYTTVAGLLLHTLGAIPGPGTVITVGGYQWTVVEMQGPKIVRVRVERARP
jgi:putative hemolysin